VLASLESNEFGYNILIICISQTQINVFTSEKYSDIYLVFSTFISRPTSLLASVKVSMFFSIVSMSTGR
jgi:hypothetical protein